MERAGDPYQWIPLHGHSERGAHRNIIRLIRIYVQAERCGASRAVGRPEIQECVGALHGAQADRGAFITTSRFTPEAIAYADRVAARVVLIDGQALSALLVRHTIGVQDQQTSVIKREPRWVPEPFRQGGRI